MKVFFGVLTHPKTSYSLANFELFGKQLDSLESISATTTFYEKNNFTLKDVSLSDVLLHPLGLLTTEFLWHRHIGRKVFASVSRQFIKTFFYYTSLLIPKNVKKAKGQILRFLNISTGSLDLLKIASGSKSDWCLIVEDDAIFKPNKLLVTELTNLSKMLASNSKDKLWFCDVSDSFTFEEMCVDHLVEKLDSFKISDVENFLMLTKTPFTNTTCALLYDSSSANFIHDTAKRILSKRIYRTLPFDLALRQGLSTLTKPRIVGFHLMPGIFKQNSLNN